MFLCDVFPRPLPQDKIQAYISEILIITNPFKRIPGIYDEEVMKQYKARRAAPHAQPRSIRHTPKECDPRDIRSTLRLSRAGPRPPPRCVQGANWTKLEPHVFATSEMAYNHMVINAQSQSLLVAGESVRRTPRHMHIMRRPPPPAPSSNRRVLRAACSPPRTAGSRLPASARCAWQGAGKTETNKQLLNYLIWRAGSVGAGTSTLSQVRAA